MLNIFAETFRIATFTDRPWLRDSLTREHRHERHRRDLWFWHGGTARDIE